MGRKRKGKIKGEYSYLTLSALCDKLFRDLAGHGHRHGLAAKVGAHAGIAAKTLLCSLSFVLSLRYLRARSFKVKRKQIRVRQLNDELHGRTRQLGNVAAALPRYLLVQFVAEHNVAVIKVEPA